MSLSCLCLELCRKGFYMYVGVGVGDDDNDDDDDNNDGDDDDDVVAVADDDDEMLTWATVAEVNTNIALLVPHCFVSMSELHIYPN